ncbi:MAG: NAD(P)H-hydrate dehydratase [Elusimicrobia bacterium]|nr:NAD(P)H-hydrate dehydratase [Elusimicrobiota bacterium]
MNPCTKFLPPRPRNANKGDFGKVLIVAGSAGMSGAAVLCAKAALKCGAGLVTIASPISAQKIIAKNIIEATTIPLPEKNGFISAKTAGVIKKHHAKRGFDVMLIGPGLGFNKDTTRAVLKIFSELKIPSVIDADALNAFAKEKSLGLIKKLKIPVILTPHPGEMARLLKIKAVGKSAAKRFSAAKLLSKKIGGVAVLKGFNTVSTDGKKSFINSTGGPMLAKGGTGDVLAGMIAGFWAQWGKAQGFSNRTALTSAILAVYLHGLCGELAAKKLTGRCIMAGELINFLPKAIKRIK